MADKIVTLKDKNDNNLYPVAGALFQDAVTTASIKNKAVTWDKMSMFFFKTVANGTVTGTNESKLVPTKTTTNYDNHEFFEVVDNKLVAKKRCVGLISGVVYTKNSDRQCYGQLKFFPINGTPYANYKTWSPVASTGITLTLQTEPIVFTAGDAVAIEVGSATQFEAGSLIPEYAGIAIVGWEV